MSAEAVIWMEPELPDMPKAVSSDAYERARAGVSASLAEVQTRLKELRAQRDEINAEIKTLVAEEELLERMERIKPKTEGTP